MTIRYDPEQKRVTVREATAFPDEVFEYAHDAEILDMSFCGLTTLPKSLERFKKLRVVFFSNNEFQTIPEALASCENLEMVGFRACKLSSLAEHALPPGIQVMTLTDNRLTSLPHGIDAYKKLKKIILTGNRLQSLPETLVNCQQMELFRVPMNLLNQFPEWIKDLPKLGWYNDGANPFHAPIQTTSADLNTYSWNDITIEEKIGQSASNEVFRAQLKNGTEVAVKLFGGELTSDGLAIDDMQTSLKVGDHQNIIGGIGTLTNTPNNKPGMVMPLIPDFFTKLGTTPSLTAYTRDTFPTDKSFSIEYIVQVLKDITSAMLHCHSNGIMHGDLYAHNILTDKNGHSYLGDFGAASFYKPGTAEGNVRELIDVKGFGYLMDDLLSRCNMEIPQYLQELRAICLNNNLLNRPKFEEIRQSF